jgi:hypothetical protein
MLAVFLNSTSVSIKSNCKLCNYSGQQLIYNREKSRHYLAFLHVFKLISRHNMAVDSVLYAYIAIKNIAFYIYNNIELF